MHFRKRFVIFVACMFALCGCRTTARSSVSVNRKGAGLVTVSVSFDKDAASALPTDLSFLGLSQLHDDGWKTMGPKQQSGALVVTATKAFSNPAQSTALLRSIAVPFGNLRLVVDQGFIHSTAKLAGTVDLTEGIASFATGDRHQQLLQMDPATATSIFGTDFSSLHLTLALRMAGKTQSVDLPMGKKTKVDLDGSQLNPALIWYLLTVLFLVIAIVMSRRAGREKSTPQKKYAAPGG